MVFATELVIELLRCHIESFEIVPEGTVGRRKKKER